MAFTHDVREESTIERRESWTAEIAGYVVSVERRDHAGTEIAISPTSGDGPWRPLVKCRPACVADLERVADVLPDVLRAVVSELRAAGLDDLRSSTDVMIAEQRQKLDAALANTSHMLAAGKPRA
jgi:hypothetical protein